MHIDWFVFFSQVVNLMILLLLLKKFLFGRIIGAIDAREAKIAARFAEAERLREEARQAKAAGEERLRDLEARYGEMLDKARQEADACRERLLEKAKEEVEFLKARWIEALRSEQNNFLQELRQLAGNQIYSVTRRVLKDLADLDLEEQIVEVLMERLAELAEEERRRFASPRHEGGKITVSSAFDISAAMRDKLDAVMRRYAAGEVDIAYERSDDILSGCELRSDGHKLAWSVKDYVDGIEERFYAALYEEARERK